MVESNHLLPFKLAVSACYSYVIKGANNEKMKKNSCRKFSEMFPLKLGQAGQDTIVRTEIKPPIYHFRAVSEIR